MRRGMREIVRWSVCALLVTILLYVAALLSIRVMGYSIAVVVSDSMLPTAQRGDLVLLRAEPQLNVGDVVLYRHHQSLILHRLSHRDTAGAWWTKGDANSVRDPWDVNSSDVIARAAGILHGFGKPILWLQRDAEMMPVAESNFVGTHSNYSQVVADMWNSPVMAWSSIGVSPDVTKTSPSAVTFTGSSDRRIYTNTRLWFDTKIHAEVRLTMQDTFTPEISFLINACTDSKDVLSCGWVVTLNQNSRLVTVRSILTTGVKSAVIASGTMAITVNLNLQTVIAIYHVGTQLVVSVNGTVCLNVANLNTQTTTVGGRIPNGGYAGMWLAATNQAVASKLVVW